MKRARVWRIGGRAIGLALLLAGFGMRHGLALAAGEAVSAKPAPATHTATPTAAPGNSQEKIVYTFENDEKLRQFKTLWQERQAAIVRMSVLKAYWDQEQSNLARLNTTFATDYQLDTAKNYVLDDQRRALIERPAVQLPTGGPAAAASAAPANPGKPKP